MFAARRLTTNDLDRIFTITRENFSFRPIDRARFLPMWSELFRLEACHTVGVDDRRLPPETRLVGFGLSVFVNDAFAEKISAGRPFLSRAFLEDWEAGKRPYLTKKEIAAANAGDGLNLVVLHFGWGDVSFEDMLKMQMIQTERFIQTHAGYLTKEYLHEVFGAQLKDFMLAGGALLKNDYRDDAFKDALAGVTDENWPYLTVQGADASRAGTIAAIFRNKSTRPRFGFSPGEQRLLDYALEGRSDEELADDLALSPWTVKKRWQKIYAKVEAVDPLVFAQEDDKLRRRRRHLLAFLRDHLEELRPFKASTPSGS